MRSDVGDASEVLEAFVVGVMELSEVSKAAGRCANAPTGQAVVGVSCTARNTDTVS